MRKNELGDQFKWLADCKKPCLVMDDRHGSDIYWIVRIPINGDWRNTYEIATPRENIIEPPNDYKAVLPRRLLYKMAFQ